MNLNSGENALLTKKEGDLWTVSRLVGKGAYVFFIENRRTNKKSQYISSS